MQELQDDLTDVTLVLEEVGKDAGLPLDAGLATWRKIVVGDRNWRIIVQMSPDETVATVWVIGDRDDSAGYREAIERLAALGSGSQEVISLSAVMLRLIQRKAKKRKHRVATAASWSPAPTLGSGEPDR